MFDMDKIKTDLFRAYTIPLRDTPIELLQEDGAVYAEFRVTSPYGNSARYFTYLGEYEEARERYALESA